MDPQIDSIVVPLPEEAPVQEEVLPAQLVGAGRYRLTAAPFVAYDVACGDLVRCEPDAGSPGRFRCCYFELPGPRAASWLHH